MTSFKLEIPYDIIQEHCRCNAVRCLNWDDARYRKTVKCMSNISIKHQPLDYGINFDPNCWKWNWLVVYSIHLKCLTMSTNCALFVEFSNVSIPNLSYQRKWHIFWNGQQTRAKPSLIDISGVNEPDHLISIQFFSSKFISFSIFFPPNSFQFHKSSDFLQNLFGFCFSSTHKSVHSIIYRRIKWWRRESCVLMRCLFFLKNKTRVVLTLYYVLPEEHQQFFFMSGLLMSFHHDQRQWLFKAPVTLPSDVDDKCIEISV